MPQFRFWDKKSDLETEVQTRIETIFGLEYFREKKSFAKRPSKRKTGLLLSLFNATG